jgi:hypothetical protein
LPVRGVAVFAAFAAFYSESTATAPDRAGRRRPDRDGAPDNPDPAGKQQAVACLPRMKAVGESIRIDIETQVECAGNSI